MSDSLRPITTGQLLDRAFLIYRQNFILFAGISALPHLCLLVALTCMELLWMSPGAYAFLDTLLSGLIEGFKIVHRDFPSLPRSVLEPFFTAAAWTIPTIFGIFILFLSLLTIAIVTAATAIGVSEVCLDHRTTISKCFALVRGKTGKVLYAFTEVGVRMVVGLILLVIPGIYWSGKYGLAVPAVVLENIMGKQACARSAVLTKDSIGRILVIYFVTWLLTYTMSASLGAALQLVFSGLTKAAGTYAFYLFQWAVSTAVRILVAPVMAIALTLVYYDQRVRKEAFDIESMMDVLGKQGFPSAEDTVAVKS